MIELYDPALHLMGTVDYALKTGYEIKHNDLSTASLEVACEDPVVQNILVPASFVRIWDGEEDLGFFRFAAIPRDEHAPQGVCTYSLQSAECTLLDDLLEGWHEIGGTGISTRDVLEYILARQSGKGMRWVLGDCDFNDYYQYNFQDVTLLEAIMSLGETLLEEYEFVFDSTSVPWTMHLRRLESEAMCSLVYRRNMTRFRRSVDGRVVTRLYGRGYGEGDNQLTIAAVNGGKDYVDADAGTMDKYGIRALDFESSEYPYRLKECPDAPIVLFCKGNATLNGQHMVGMVGTRRSTDYGRTLAVKLVEDLAGKVADVTIVSG